MQMQGSRQLNASAQDAWQALNDPEILKQCIPGCQKFEAESENVYLTAANIKIGPVSAKFTGRVELTDINPPHSYSLHFEAQGGVAGHGKGTSHVELVETDDGVELKYTVESQVGGKLAQLGQRLVDGAAKSMADDFFKRFEKALQEKTAGDAPSGEPTDTAANGGEESSAADTPEAGTVAQAQSKPSFPKWLWIAIIASILMILIVI
ncbi:CoxG family protein [Orrella marina]|uniref:Carbon monoxide dehydrogenase n=1 Tax=Orrella marina TaxID=2163011 RepID=A0A2R4XKU6_9BURK|nr:carbon monoxide dehydrogenase subunit G [Orrella marina]AWB34436.1 carbon monoxide dehydrogenase [Orrella marina]